MNTRLKRTLTLGILCLMLIYSFLQTASVSAQGQCVLPLEGTYTVTNGPNEGLHHGGSREAIDLSANAGTAVYPCKPGKVIFAGYHSSLFGSYGNLVKVQHTDGTVSYYAHLKTINVQVGQTVGYTTKLGEVNATGTVFGKTGNHLHFEVRDRNGNAVSVRYLVDWNTRTATGPSRSSLVAQSETFFLDTPKISARSSMTLINGQAYKVIISGTFSYWVAEHWSLYGVCTGQPEPSPVYPSPGRTNGLVGADPEYNFAHPNDGLSCAGGVLVNPGYRYTTLLFSTDGGKTFRSLVPIRAGYDPAHVYEYRIIGKGDSLVIKLGDWPYYDNYGQLKIAVGPWS